MKKQVLVALALGHLCALYAGNTSDPYNKFKRNVEKTVETAQEFYEGAKEDFDKNTQNNQPVQQIIAGIGYLYQKPISCIAVAFVLGRYIPKFAAFPIAGLLILAGIGEQLSTEKKSQK